VAYDCQNQELVQFKVYPLLGTGDGPMLAALANSLGPKASYACIYGKHGGTNTWKRSKAGVLSAIQVCLVLDILMLY
jgi:hypothetical protein